MSLHFKYETLNDWVNKFLELVESKFQSKTFNFTIPEYESFGNAFYIALIENEYIVNIFSDGIAYTSDSSYEEVKNGFLEVIEENRSKYEAIVKFLVYHRSDAVQNLDWLDLTFVDDDIVVLSGYNSMLDVNKAKVLVSNKEYTIEEFILAVEE